MYTDKFNKYDYYFKQQDKKMTVHEEHLSYQKEVINNLQSELRVQSSI